jgi:Kdo2-lipid IVA lauroyltransferase/acyltransferase
MLQFIFYYLSLPFLYLIAALPRFLRLGLSDIFFLLIYYVIGYRKNVVYENLRKSFPEKTEEEILTIRKKFYRYFCDLVPETLHLLTVSKKNMQRICRLHPSAIQLFDKYANEKKSIITVMGHWGNWEWAQNGFSAACSQQLFIIFHPLHNPYFNRMANFMRSRFGTKLIPMKDTLREMIQNKNCVSVTAFAADQTPPPSGAYWTTFLNQETPVFFGPEKIARKLNYPVIYISIKRIKRGFYEVFAETLVENSAETKEGEISELHTRRLERDIREIPEIWLWSHRRWKHKKPM